MVKLQMQSGPAKVLAMAAAIASLLPKASSESVGDCVCHEGFIMDNYCINRGTLFDNDDVPTLGPEGPEVHTIHCLFDVPQCINGGYAVLVPDGSGNFTVKYQFDETGNSLITDHAITVAAKNTCNDCDGAAGGTQTDGLRATIVGRVLEEADPVSGTAARLAVTEVLHTDVGCASFECADTNAPTTAPLRDDQTPLGVDCSEFQTTIALSDKLTLSFVVNTPRNDTGVDLPLEAIEGGGLFSAQLEYEGDGWIAFGTSTNGKMIGSEAIIGIPNGDTFTPTKYTMSALSAAGINERGNDQQTLIDATGTQGGGRTIMTFSHILSEADHIPINPNGKNTFVWATGTVNSLAYHGGNRGSVSLTLQACSPTGVADIEVQTLETDTYQSLWRTHAIMAGIAWAFFTPVAVAASMLRKLIPGEGGWYQIHRAFNILTYIFTIVAVSCAIRATGQSGADHLNGTHQKVGIAIFAIVSVQVFWAYCRPHLPPKVKTASDEDDEENPDKDNEAEQPKAKKSAIRTFWEYKHRLVGLALLGMAFYNLDGGLQLYEVRFETDDYRNVLWGWLGAFMGVVFLLYIFVNLRK